MKFKYATSGPGQTDLEKLPRIPLTLSRDGYNLTAIGLVDSGATVNVLPFELGLRLGASWQDAKATLPLAGNLAAQRAIPLAAFAYVGNFAPVHLVFAWTRNEKTPLILGQTNFFMEFDVCFYRSQDEFEVKLKADNA